MDAVPQKRQRDIGHSADSGEARAKFLELLCRRQLAVPEQPRGFLERRVLRELGEREAGNRQLAALAVDVAQPRFCGDDAVQSVVYHDRNVNRTYDVVNIDW